MADELREKVYDLVHELEKDLEDATKALNFH